MTMQVQCGVGMRRMTLLSACTIGVGGCGCKGVALNSVSPPEVTLAVGQSATLSYSTGGACRSGNKFTDVDLHEAPTIWRSSDTLVVTVDSLTGRVTGLRPGDATVYSGGGSSAAIHVH